MAREVGAGAEGRAGAKSGRWERSEKRAREAGAEPFLRETPARSVSRTATVWRGRDNLPEGARKLHGCRLRHRRMRNSLRHG